MKPLKFLWAIVFSCSVVVSSAWAQQFDEVFVFGDSLSDTGNIYAASSQAFPPSPPYGGIPGVHPEFSPGHFSDGRVWIEYVADAIGAGPVAPRGVGLLPEGTNYAQGGAVSGGEPATYTSTLGLTVSGGLPVTQQVGIYLTDVTFGLVAPPSEDTLLVVWGGSNDLLLLENPDPFESVFNIFLSIEALIAAGGRNIVVPNMPLLTKTPAVQQGVPSFFSSELNSAQVRRNMRTFNFLLRVTLNILEHAHPNVTFYRVNVARLMRDVLSNPAAHGIDNTVVPVISEPDLFLGGQLVVQGNPFTSFYWDGVHPTTRVHQILAENVLEILP